MVTNAPASTDRSYYERPLQTIPYSKKTQEWFKDNIRFHVRKANFSTGQGGTRKDLGLLYGVYNNKFPLSWFQHVTNPLSAKKPEHKAYPAKIRPINILRTNIDLLMGEYPRRPFVYNVSNLGETGYSRFLEAQGKVAIDTLTEHFIRSYLEEAQASGRQLTPEEMEKLQTEPPIPEQVSSEFKASYKDAIAIKGQKWLKRIIRKEEVRSKLHLMFKDWLITGEAYSYKSVENNKIVYKEISPLCLDYDKSHDSHYVEDGSWVVCRNMQTLPDIVDRFYRYLKTEDLQSMESSSHLASANHFYDFLKSSVTTDLGGTDKIPTYHVQWKGRKKIGFLSYLDLETFKYEEDIVDENYIVDREAGEQVEWRWVNEVYEGWWLSEDIFCGMGPCEIQRNEMNNLSTCKLSYNGRKYSDRHADNISVLEVGIPIQIMHTITGYVLEKTIAKSKGKIVLLDRNTIADDEEWDEEKFFYYGEAQGYALIDRSLPGVDKTWNQYQVLDLSLFDQIKQLIELMEHYKQQWDDLIGISRQRKGQTYSSDGQGVNERAVFQSTVITDMIFLYFEEFRARELQGLLDLSRFATADGLYELWNGDDYLTELLEILPGEMMEELGVFCVDSSEELRKLNEMKAVAQAMMQNGYKATSVMEVIEAENIAELKQKLKGLEEIQQRIDAILQDAEYEAQAAADERAKDMREFESLLDIRKQNNEYDRKEELEYIKGSFNTFTFQDGDSNDNGVPDAAEVQKLLQGQQKITQDYENKKNERNQKYQEMDIQITELKHKMWLDKENLKRADRKLDQGDKKLKIDAKKAVQKPKAPARKK